ncbi:response regulator transcription factor [bacterium]|nr:response regulator transcription factor [bacterium]
MVNIDNSAETENKPHILIIDDDPFRLRAITLILSRKGYELTLADSGERGLELLTRQRCDLILLDVVLPGISGLEFCRKIKSDNDLNTIPVVLLSSTLVSSQAQAEGLEVGAEGYLSWPISSRELVARVALAIRLLRAQGNKVADTILTIEVDGFSVLTPRQREVVHLIAQGLTTREVSANLGIRLRTAETHRAAAMRALDLHSVAELVNYSFRHGMR